MKSIYIDEIRRQSVEIRNSKEYKEWRIKVFERDNFHCVFCNRKRKSSKGIRLEADHIKPFLLFPELMFDVNNGRTLCNLCHRKTETYGNSIQHRRAHEQIVHPFLKGEYLLKIKSLPSSIKVGDGFAGFNLKYRPIVGKWSAGYGRQSTLGKCDTSGDTPEEAIDSLIVALEMSARTDFSKSLKSYPFG